MNDDPLIDPLIAAATLTLAEMAQTTLAVRSVSRDCPPCAHGEFVVELDLTSATGPGGSLVLCVPEATAQALAGRVLAGVATAPDADLIGDCMGEITNVIAGQVKALLAGTPYHFTFQPPRIASAGAPADRLGECLVIAFESDAGAFALRLDGPTVLDRSEEA